MTGFAAALAVGTLLLVLPVASTEDGSANVVDALFTATSALCVTGLTTVNTPDHWTAFGHVVIMILIRIGGIGIMALATLLALLVSRRSGCACASTRAPRRRTSLWETCAACSSASHARASHSRRSPPPSWRPPLHLARRSFGRAPWLGVLHAVSAFNNAGFTLFSDSLKGFADNPFILGAMSVLVIAGGRGFPVLFELRREWRAPRRGASTRSGRATATCAGSSAAVRATRGATRTARGIQAAGDHQHAHRRPG